MPRRRRKYRPPRQEQEKTPPFFAKAHKKAPIPVLISQDQRTDPRLCVEQAQQGALEILHAVTIAIKDSQPEQALQNQKQSPGV